MNGRSPSASIPMGEIGVSLNNGTLRTLLGSCLGVALYDRRLKVGALAHVVLPCSRGPTELPGKFADTAVPAMIERMQVLAGGELRLTAKVAGGANMFSTTTSNTVGTQNIQAMERILEGLRIPVLGRHYGGEQGRRMTLDTTSGIVIIEVVGAEPITL